MNLKTLIAVFVIVGIGVLLLRTKSGMEFAGNTLDFLKVKVGNFVTGLSSSSWSGEGAGGFRVLLNVVKDAFAEQSYDLDGSDLSVTGIVEGSVKIGDIDLHKERMAVELKLENAKGKFEYTVAGTVKFAGSAEMATVDGNDYTHTSGKVKVSFEMVPLKFLLTDLAVRKVVLESATGSIARMNADNTIKSTEELSGEKIEITKFVGLLQMEGTNIRLDGLTSSVKGVGPQSSFSW